MASLAQKYEFSVNFAAELTSSNTTFRVKREFGEYRFIFKILKNSLDILHNLDF